MSYEVYLIGMMEFASDHGKGWREEATKKFAEHAIAVWDPCNEEIDPKAKYGIKNQNDLKKVKREDPLLYCKVMREIIRHDLNALGNCDAALIYIQKNMTGGSIAEVTYANRTMMKTVVAVLEPGLNYWEVSGWVLGCCDYIASNLDDGIKVLVDKRDERDLAHRLPRHEVTDP